MSNTHTSIIETAAAWWGEMMIPNPDKRKQFCAQLEDMLREKEKTASDHEAVFVLGVGHRPHPILAQAIENAELTKEEVTSIDGDDPVYMFLDFRDRKIDVQTGYRASLQALYPR